MTWGGFPPNETVAIAQCAQGANGRSQCSDTVTTATSDETGAGLIEDFFVREGELDHGVVCGEGQPCTIGVASGDEAFVAVPVSFDEASTSTTTDTSTSSTSSTEPTTTTESTTTTTAPSTTTSTTEAPTTTTPTTTKPPRKPEPSTSGPGSTTEPPATNNGGSQPSQPTSTNNSSDRSAAEVVAARRLRPPAVVAISAIQPAGTQPSSSAAWRAQADLAAQLELNTSPFSDGATAGLRSATASGRFAAHGTDGERPLTSDGPSAPWLIIAGALLVLAGVGVYARSATSARG